MTMFTRLFAIILLSSMSYCALAVSSFSAEYQLSKGAFSLGVMTRTLNVDAAGRYVFESVMEANAVVSLFTASRVTEISRGRIEGSRFVPEYYRYEKNSKKKDYELSFDYATNVVMRSDNGPAWRAEMPDQLLDKLSYQGQMITDVAANPQTLNYTVADRGKLKDYDIRNLGVEDVETTLGKFRSIKLQRGDKNSKRQTTVWFAEELGWMPVKVEYRDKKGGLTTGLLHTLNSGD